MRLDVEDVADGAALDHAFELAHRGKAALVVAAAKHDAGVAAGRDRAGGVLTRQGQRLLAPDRLPGAGDRLDLRHVERMRRRQEHGLHGGIGDGLGEVGGEPKAVLAAKPRTSSGSLLTP